MNSDNLRRNILVILLSCIYSFNALGEEYWYFYEDDEVANSYIDLNSIHRVGDVTSYKALINFKQKKTLMHSSVTTYEVKCLTEQIRFIKSVSFSELLGKGKAIGAMTPEMLGQKDGFSRVAGDKLRKQVEIVCRKQ